MNRLLATTVALAFATLALPMVDAHTPSTSAPDPCPPVKTIPGFKTRADAERALQNAGYHKVARWASWNYGNDWARSDFRFGDHPTGAYRIQGIVYPDGDAWKIARQGTYDMPEPNPEEGGHLGWRYVYHWHTSFC